MIRHLLRLTWNRKRTTALLFLELVGCFLVLCAVATGVAFTIDNWRRPLGFRYDNTWRLELGYGEYYRAPEQQRREAVLGAQRLLAEVQSMPEVEAAGLMENSPYSTSTSSWTFEFKGSEVDVNFANITLDLPKALGLQLVKGRWFEPGDAALAFRPVVISRNLARARFGDTDPLGQLLRSRLSDTADEHETELRVVGVIEDYRRNGETLAAPYNAFAFASIDPARAGDRDSPPTELLVRVRPGTSARFEEALVRRVQQVVPTWGFDVTTMEQARSRMLRLRMLPLIVLGTIGVFLLSMVGFGLVGVLWQSVARRTSELGLRRALGASADRVRGQIVGELLAVAVAAMLIGTAIFLQLPTLGTFSFLSWRIYLFGWVGALVILTCFVVGCGLYPGWMATRIHPARALQHE